ncbi:MAG: ABC transporter substrate-binding protein [Oligoflexales bacterium]|nr:ABC transporter substrate-binding protein [Oligoflexales bacterium]
MRFLRKKTVLSFVTGYLLSLAPLVISDHASAGPKKLSIAMITWRGETDAEAGFKAAVKELGYDVTYTSIDAGQNQQNLVRLLNEQIKPGVFSYIYTFGTTTSVTAKEFLKGTTPQIFNVVSFPVGARLVKSEEASQENITGVSNFSNASEQMINARKILKFKRLGVMYNANEMNSVITRNKLEEVGLDLGFVVVDLKIPPKLEDAEKNMELIAAKKGEYDVLYTGADSFVLSAAKVIGKVIAGRKIIAIGGSADLIKNGSYVMGTYPDYRECGIMAAKIVDRHQKGEKIEVIPVQRPQPKFYIVTERAASLGIKIPPEMKGKFTEL